MLVHYGMPNDGARGGSRTRSKGCSLPVPLGVNIAVTNRGTAARRRSTADQHRRRIRGRPRGLLAPHADYLMLNIELPQHRGRPRFLPRRARISTSASRRWARSGLRLPVFMKVSSVRRRRGGRARARRGGRRTPSSRASCSTRSPGEAAEIAEDAGGGAGARMPGRGGGARRLLAYSRDRWPASPNATAAWTSAATCWSRPAACSPPRTPTPRSATAHRWCSFFTAHGVRGTAAGAADRARAGATAGARRIQVGREAVGADVR